MSLGKVRSGRPTVWRGCVLPSPAYRRWSGPRSPPARTRSFPGLRCAPFRPSPQLLGPFAELVHSAAVFSAVKISSEPGLPTPLELYGRVLKPVGQVRDASAQVLDSAGEAVAAPFHSGDPGGQLETSASISRTVSLAVSGRAPRPRAPRPLPRFRRRWPGLPR